MKACIFDLDGTLMDTVTTLAYFVNDELGKYGMENIPTEKFKVLAGRGARNLIKGALEIHGKCDDVNFEDKVLAGYNAVYDANSTFLSKPYDGIVDLLDMLKAKGVKLAVLTNKPDSTAHKVVSHFFGSDCFDVIVGQKEGVPIKPDPVGANEIMSILNLDRSECVYVGDTATDMKTGKNAGLFTIGVLWGFRDRDELEANGADVIVELPEEILSYV